jgi:hypothetical protein
MARRSQNGFSVEVIMLARSAIGFIGFATFATLVTACTVESPTYVSQDPYAGDTDGGSSPTSSGSNSQSGSASSGSDAGGGGSASDSGATCNGNDFAKPDLSKLTACGDGHGHCYDKNKTPGADQLVACPDPSQVCVYDAVLEAAGGKLKSCTSIINTPGGCFDKSFMPIIDAMGGAALKPDVCASNEVCIPCADPGSGKSSGFCDPQGVHENACGATPAPSGDGGTTPPPPPLPACCTTKGVSNGVCLDASKIPSSQQSQAPQDSCASGTKCVPKALVQGMPVKCDGGLLGKGICMDQCFNEFLGLAGDIGILSTKGCGSTEVCAPCSFISGNGITVPGCE